MIRTEPWTPVHDRAAEVIDRHQPSAWGGCTCGWHEPGAGIGHNEHVAQVLGNLGLLADPAVTT